MVLIGSEGWDLELLIGAWVAEWRTLCRSDGRTFQKRPRSTAWNLIWKCELWDRDVVVLVDDNSEFEERNRVEYVIMKTAGDHYQALLKDGSAISKPDYDSSANIPLHHDGKHGQSFGDTRSESHATKSIKNRKSR